VLQGPVCAHCGTRIAGWERRLPCRTCGALPRVPGTPPPATLCTRCGATDRWQPARHSPVWLCACSDDPPAVPGSAQ
jgi:hypothetical protein